MRHGNGAAPVRRGTPLGSGPTKRYRNFVYT